MSGVAEVQKISIHVVCPRRQVYPKSPTGCGGSRIAGKVTDDRLVYDNVKHLRHNRSLSQLEFGFYMDEECTHRLTPKTNLIFDVRGCNPNSYGSIKIKRDLDLLENPVRGGRWDYFRTILRDFQLLIIFSNVYFSPQIT